MLFKLLKPEILYKNAIFPTPRVSTAIPVIFYSNSVYLFEQKETVFS